MKKIWPLTSCWASKDVLQEIFAARPASWNIQAFFFRKSIDFWLARRTYWPLVRSLAKAPPNFLDCKFRAFYISPIFVGRILHHFHHFHQFRLFSTLRRRKPGGWTRKHWRGISRCHGSGVHLFKLVFCGFDFAVSHQCQRVFFNMYEYTIQYILIYNILLYIYIYLLRHLWYVYSKGIKTTSRKWSMILLKSILIL